MWSSVFWITTVFVEAPEIRTNQIGSFENFQSEAVPDSARSKSFQIGTPRLSNQNDFIDVQFSAQIDLKSWYSLGQIKCLAIGERGPKYRTVLFEESSMNPQSV